MLRKCHELPPVPNDKEISMIEKPICETTLEHAEGIPCSEKPEIRKGVEFNSFEELTFFLSDYAVRLRRPFSVLHSDKNVRYEVACKQGCMWRMWYRKVLRLSQWKITKVMEPNTCHSSQPKQAQPQCTSNYLTRCMLGIVRKDSETSIPSIIESIFILLWVPCEVFEGMASKTTRCWTAMG